MEELLTAILLELQKANAPKLGFTEPPTPVWIYANRSNGCNWYRVKDGNPEPIAHLALTGYLEKVEIEMVERRNKEAEKFRLYLKGDRPYVVESGKDTHFTKGIVAALALMTPSQLKQPITIMPQAGSDDSVLFCKIFSAGQGIFAPYGEDTNWKNVGKMARDAVVNAGLEWAKKEQQAI